MVNQKDILSFYLVLKHFFRPYGLHTTETKSLRHYLLAVCDRFRLIHPRREIGYIQISADFIAIIKIHV